MCFVDFFIHCVLNLFSSYIKIRKISGLYIFLCVVPFITGHFLTRIFIFPFNPPTPPGLVSLCIFVQGR